MAVAMALLKKRGERVAYLLVSVSVSRDGGEERERERFVMVEVMKVSARGWLHVL